MLLSVVFVGSCQVRTFVTGEIGDWSQVDLDTMIVYNRFLLAVVSDRTVFAALAARGHRLMSLALEATVANVLLPFLIFVLQFFVAWCAHALPR
jgi:hypothetical protein